MNFGHLYKWILITFLFKFKTIFTHHLFFGAKVLTNLIEFRFKWRLQAVQVKRHLVVFMPCKVDNFQDLHFRFRKSKYTFDCCNDQFIYLSYSIDFQNCSCERFQVGQIMPMTLLPALVDSKSYLHLWFLIFKVIFLSQK